MHPAPRFSGKGLGQYRVLPATFKALQKGFMCFPQDSSSRYQEGLLFQWKDSGRGCTPSVSLAFRDGCRQTPQRRAQAECLHTNPGRCTCVPPTGRRRHGKAILGTHRVVLPGTSANARFTCRVAFFSG